MLNIYSLSTDALYLISLPHDLMFKIPLLEGFATCRDIFQTILNVDACTSIKVNLESTNEKETYKYIVTISGGDGFEFYCNSHITESLLQYTMFNPKKYIKINNSLYLVFFNEELSAIVTNGYDAKDILLLNGFKSTKKIIINGFTLYETKASKNLIKCMLDEYATNILGKFICV